MLNINIFNMYICIYLSIYVEHVFEMHIKRCEEVATQSL